MLPATDRKYGSRARMIRARKPPLQERTARRQEEERNANGDEQHAEEPADRHARRRRFPVLRGKHNRQSQERTREKQDVHDRLVLQAEPAGRRVGVEVSGSQAERPYRCSRRRVPPRSGSTILAIIGWTTNSSDELRKRVMAKSGTMGFARRKRYACRPRGEDRQTGKETRNFAGAACCRLRLWYADYRAELRDDVCNCVRTPR